MFYLIYARTYGRIHLYFYKPFKRRTNTVCKFIASFNLPNLDDEKKMIKKIKLLCKNYKGEIIFTFALMIICFSVALWAIGMNAIKLNYVIGSY